MRFLRFLSALITVLIYFSIQHASSVDKKFFSSIILPKFDKSEVVEKLIANSNGSEVYLITSIIESESAENYRKKINIYKLSENTFKSLTHYVCKKQLAFSVVAGNSQIYIIFFEYPSSDGEVNITDIISYSDGNWQNISQGCPGIEGHVDYFAEPILYANNVGHLIIKKSPNKKDSKICLYNKKWLTSMDLPGCFLGTYSDSMTRLFNSKDGLSILCVPENYIIEKYGQDSLFQKPMSKAFWLFKETSGKWQAIAKSEDFKDKEIFLLSLVQLSGLHYFSYLEGKNNCFSSSSLCNFGIKVSKEGRFEEIPLPSILSNRYYYKSDIMIFKEKLLLFTAQSDKKDNNLFIFTYDGKSWNKEGIVSDFSRNDKFKVFPYENKLFILFKKISTQEYVVELIK